MNVILCGLPKSGKTTVGKALSQTLRMNFVDTDCLIENAFATHNKEKLSCREIFERKGEAFFRTLEKQQVFTLKGTTQSIIAIGGGTLLTHENALLIGSLGCIIYLKISMERVLERFLQHTIPPYLYPSRSKNRDLDLRDATGANDQEMAPHYKPNPYSSTGCGVDPKHIEPSLRRLAENRIPTYERASHLIIMTDGLCVDEIVELIIKNTGLK